MEIECRKCHNMIEVPVNPSQLNAINSGKFVQDVLPNVDPGLREMLISGICSKCWDKLFSEEED